MPRRFVLSILVAMGALLGLLSVGCISDSSPTAPAIDKPATGLGQVSVSSHRGSQSQSNLGKPMKGTFRAFEPVWFVSHFFERTCNATLVAGAEAHSSGNVTQLGLTDVTISAAWDWADHASGEHDPTGPTTSSSATILGTYPYDFCSSTNTATGAVTLVSASGDEVHGVVAGGEVYELDYDSPGDGQEQFIEVTITGGTGRFAHASGSFVIHAIAKLDRSAASSEILPGGTIRY